jgi:hypothetical protein
VRRTGDDHDDYDHDYNNHDDYNYDYNDHDDDRAAVRHVQLRLFELDVEPDVERLCRRVHLRPAGRGVYRRRHVHV